MSTIIWEEGKVRRTVDQFSMIVEVKSGANEGHECDEHQE